jgi:hypothetical protein
MIHTRGRLTILLLAAPLLAALLLSAHTQPTIRVAPMNTVGPRPVESQTQSAVIRDYLLAWKSMNTALSENRASALEGSFVGQARDKLIDTIGAQQNIGIRTSYQDKSHDIKVVFYSPEGLSIQLTDEVEYSVALRNGDRELGSQQVHARYVAVLTPTESKWKVRVFQGGAQ